MVFATGFECESAPEPDSDIDAALEAIRPAAEKFLAAWRAYETASRLTCARCQFEYLAALGSCDNPKCPR